MNTKITIVTPNFNGGQFLERTILSVIEQNYPNLEYIIVDGGSRDNSLAIVENYRSHFSRVISEPDRGHADAVNKGLSFATGEVLGWINSDDFLMPGSLSTIDRVFRDFEHVEWITGRPSTANEAGTVDPRRALRRWSWQRFVCGDFRHIQQESTFWRRRLWNAAGGALDTNLTLANDFDLWLRFFERAPLYTVDALLGCFRVRSGQRSAAHAEDYQLECEAALQRFINRLPLNSMLDVFPLIGDDQLISRRSKPVELHDLLPRSDPPVISLDASAGGSSFEAFDTSYSSSLAAVEEREDLIFDGADRAIWTSGPDFGAERLEALELDFVPFSNALKVTAPLGEYSPPMPLVIGSIALSDWGSGKFSLQIKGAEGVIVVDLETTAGRTNRLRVVFDDRRYAVLLDGRIRSAGDFPGLQATQAKFAIVGGGFAQRYWLGKILRLTVSSRTRQGEARSRILLHSPGTYRLQRQFNPNLPDVRRLRTNVEDCVPSSLTPWRGKHRGQRCFVMGNGPSLNKMDLSKLEGEVVFACNSAFLLFDRINWRPTYYTCVDVRVIRDRGPEITAVLDQNPGITGFFPSVVHLHDGSGRSFAGRSIIAPGPNRNYFNEVGNRESHHVETMFSLDPDDAVVQPYTVAITMLQLAIYMGFTDVYLIGCDTSYKVHETVRQDGREIDGVGLLLTSTKDDDENHFDPRYFGAGREWHNPQVPKMIDHYRWAKLASHRAGVTIRNATVGGQLEVFERVDFLSLFPKMPVPAQPVRPRPPLLSIAIPAYDRAGPLRHALESFVAQIEGRFESEVEIVVSDDCTPGDRLGSVRDYARRYGFIKWRRYDSNKGLERNLLACADACSGEYLWLFGDDDYLERKDALEIILDVLRRSSFDMLVLNRTRRNSDLKVLLSDNWMNIDPASSTEFTGLREFCLHYGLISVLGFISVNIFRRRRYLRVSAAKYMGTMYPQLGAMIEAFHTAPTLLIGTPLVCHRTQTAEEKRAALGNKATEAAFMADAKRRNAVYFSHPYIAMVQELVRQGAFTYHDLSVIRENTVINGLLVDFLIQCLKLNHELPDDDAGRGSDDQWSRAADFMESLPLSAPQKLAIEPVLALHRPPGRDLSFSVVTPSFNQADFLGECLDSVRGQSHAALEHFVFDPGSKDGSQDIARSFQHVTLVAEPDEGQSDALNKGFARVRGDIICWLNSDDMLADEHVFRRVAARFAQSDSPDIVYGRGVYVDEQGTKLRDAYINADPSSLNWRFAQEDGIMQPALFMRRSVVETVGPLRNDLHYSMDYEYWIRCVKAGIKFAFIDEVLAIARYHISNKTYGQRGNSYAEVCRMIKQHFGFASSAWVRRYAEFLSDGHDGVLAHAQNAGTKNAAELEAHYARLLVEYNGDDKAQAILRAGKDNLASRDTFNEMSSLGLLRLPSPGVSVLGPFSRDDHAHVDETGAVSKLFERGAVVAAAIAQGHDQPGVMIDVGAHYGLALAPFLEQGWRIHAFEPDASNRAALEKRLHNHPRSRAVSIDTRAVTRLGGEVLSFYRSDVSTGISGLSAFHETHREVDHVQTVSLSTYIDANGVQSVDFLKIDTEGFDLFVLQGFPFDKIRPQVIECEYEDGKTVPLGYSFHDLAEYLVAKGYEVYVSEWHPIVRYGIQHDWRRLAKYPCDLQDSNGWGNLLAFARPVDEQELCATLRPRDGVGASPSVQRDPGKPSLMTGRSFESLSADTWRVIEGGGPADRLWARVFWGRGIGSFVGVVGVSTDRPIRLRITLGRFGSSEWEGAGKVVEVEAGGMRHFSLRHRFTELHEGIKIQLEILAGSSHDGAKLTVSYAAVLEAVDSIAERVPESAASIKVPNAAVMRNDFASALPYYIFLKRLHGLSMYHTAAQFAARRLGLDPALPVDVLDDTLLRS